MVSLLLILVTISRHLDNHGVTNIAPGEPPPCLIVDGHGLRLSIPFLTYINNLDKEGNQLDGANHRWKVFVGFCQMELLIGKLLTVLTSMVDTSLR